MKTQKFTVELDKELMIRGWRCTVIVPKNQLIYLKLSLKGEFAYRFESMSQVLEFINGYDDGRDVSDMLYELT